MIISMDVSACHSKWICKLLHGTGDAKKENKCYAVP
jgi:hypothetical protein